jgi:small GTP-binding protein
MVGVFGTGKTSLVRQFVHSKFQDRYLSTVGVKVDRKQVEVFGKTVNIMLWDLAGRDDVEDIQTSYLRGAAAILFVVDGTRRETYEQVFELRDIVRNAIGEVPSIVALNKSDLESEWALATDDYARLESEGMEGLLTSAKTGEHVEQAFQRLAALTVKQ